MADKDKDLSETKRIMARLVNAPHKPQAELKVGKRAESKVTEADGQLKTRRVRSAVATKKKKKAAKPPSR